MQFRLIRGIHIQNHPTEIVPGSKTKENPQGWPADQLFRARRPGDPPTFTGDIVESDTDLCEKLPNKFMPLYDPANPVGVRTVEKIVEKVKYVPLDFETATVEELVQYAAEEEIDLGDAAKDRNKALKVIRDARRARQAKT